MARSYNPALASWQGKRGAVKKKIVYRNRGGITFVSRYPDMSNVQLSKLQKNVNGKFADAVKFAQEIVHDPVKKAAYPKRKGKTVYHSAISDYLDLYLKA